MAFNFPEKAMMLFDEEPRYLVLYGGRGSAKSWGAAQRLIVRAMERPTRILCARMFQNSINASVYKLLVDIIEREEVGGYFTITRDSIKGINGSEFLFKGIANNIAEIKSMEGIDICWVEEAQNVTRESWDILIPTIRAEHSQIIITFNPDQASDETYQRFVLHPPNNCKSVLINYYDNPFCPQTLVDEAEQCKKDNYERWQNIWDGKPFVSSASQVFKDKYIVQEFETPDTAHLLFGADWGTVDPTVLLRCWIDKKMLYIDYCVARPLVDLREIPDFFDKVPGCRRGKIIADRSRPETIFYIRNAGFNIEGSEKLAVEDGVEFIRGNFDKIVIHPRCTELIDEMKFYSYKRDRNTGEVMRKYVDKYNHCIDSMRYALQSLIMNKGQILIDEDWEKELDATAGAFGM